MQGGKTKAGILNELDDLKKKWNKTRCSLEQEKANNYELKLVFKTISDIEDEVKVKRESSNNYQILPEGWLQAGRI